MLANFSVCREQGSQKRVMREFFGVNQSRNPTPAATERVVGVVSLVGSENNSPHPVPIAYSHGLRSAVCGIVAALIKPMV
jgi:hypothetical protein